MRKYYIAEDNNRKGPFTIDDLHVLNLDVNTLIWYKGLSHWKEAKELPELNHLFNIYEEETSTNKVNANYLNYILVAIIILTVALSYYWRNDVSSILKLSSPTKISDKYVKVMWREKKQTVDDLGMKNEVDRIRFDTAYLQKMSEPEKAAICLIGSYLGSDCDDYSIPENESDWDANMRKSNPYLYLKGGGFRCAITNALGLDEYDSGEHIKLLKKWYSGEPKLAELSKVDVVQRQGTNGSTNLNYINLTVKNDTLILAYEYNYLGRADSVTEKETTYLKLENNCLKIISLGEFLKDRI